MAKKTKVEKTPICITRYRVDTWLNKTNNQAMYGIGVRIEGLKGWARVSCDNIAVIRNTKAEAQAYILAMKAERDKQGYKLLRHSIHKRKPSTPPDYSLTNPSTMGEPQ